MLTYYNKLPKDKASNVFYLINDAFKTYDLAIKKVKNSLD